MEAKHFSGLRVAILFACIIAGGLLIGVVDLLIVWSFTN